MRSTMMYAPFPVMIYAEDGQIIQLNDVWTELSGYGIDDVPTFNDWCRKAQPELRPCTSEDMDALFECEQRVEEGEQPVLTTYGTRVIWDFSSAPLGRLDDGRRAVLRMAADVTNRRELERALQRTNRRLQAMVKACPLAIIVGDVNNRVRVWSPAAERMFAWKEEEVLGKAPPSIPPEHQPDHAKMRIEVSRSQQPVYYETVQQTKDGRRIDVGVWATALFEDNGASDGEMGLLVDITERKRNEEALRRSEQRNRALLAAIPDLMFRLSRDGVYLDYVSVTEQALVPPDQFLGRTMSQVLPPDVAEPGMRALRQAASTGQLQTFEFSLVKSGQRRYYEGRFVACGPDEVLLIIRNITEQHLGQEALRRANHTMNAVLRATPHAIVVISPDGIVRSWNPAAEAAFGWREDEVIGKPLPLIPAEQLALFNQNRSLLMTGQAPPVSQVPCRRSDGSVGMYHMAIAPLADEDGQVSSLMGILSETPLPLWQPNGGRHATNHPHHATQPR